MSTWGGDGGSIPVILTSGDDASGVGRALEAGLEVEISCVGYGAGPSGLGGAGEVVHLAGGDVMEVEVGIGGRALRQVVMELHHCWTKEDLLIRLGGAVRMQFYEEPVRAAGDA